MQCLNPRCVPRMQRSLQENDDEEHGAFEDGSVEAVFSFADQLEIGCSLARLREDTRLQALEATECIIATNTRHCFRVSEENIARAHCVSLWVQMLMH